MAPNDRRGRGPLVRTTASAVNSPFKIGKELAQLADRDVIFIDEVHGLSRLTMEMLYTAMEDGRIDISSGKGDRTKSISVTLAMFTLVAATTMPGKLDPAFRGRFSYVASLDYYSGAALGTIIERAAAKRGLVLAESAALTLGERSRGTPRTALHLLTQAADYAVVTEEPEITPDVVLDSLALHGIDGVRRPDVRSLRRVREAGPVAGGAWPIDVITPSGGGCRDGVADRSDDVNGGGGSRELPNGLIAAVVRGDRRAREELLALIQPLVLRYCRARLGRQESVLGSADDVAQDVCLAVVSALGSYQPAGLSFRAFVYGIAVPPARRRGIGRVTPRPFTISRRWMSALPLISTTPRFFAKVR